MRPLLCCLLAVTGCHVRGNGVLRTQPRQVGPVTAVEVTDALDVRLVDRPVGPLTLTADENLLPLILTSNQGGVLRVHVEDLGALAPSAPIVIELPLTHVRRLAVSGASSVEADVVLVCEQIELVVTSASRLTLGEVAAESVSVSASSASRVSARELYAASARLQASSASQIEASAGELADATVEASSASGVDLGEVAVQRALLRVSSSSRATLRASAAAKGLVSAASHVRVRGAPAARDIATESASTVTYD